MISKLTAVLSALTLAYTANAQTQNLGNSEIGIHVGPGISLLYNQHPAQNPRTPDKPTANAFAVGFSYQYNFPKIVSIVSELNYQRTGDILYHTYTYNNTGEQVIYTANTAYDRINYITMPMYAKLSFGKTIRFFANVGFYAGFRLNSIRSVSNTDYLYQSTEQTAASNNYTLNTTAATNKIDGGLVTGMGVAFPIGKMVALTFEARNNMGFAKVNNNADVFPINKYNNSTSFLFGLNLKLSKPGKMPNTLK